MHIVQFATIMVNRTKVLSINVLKCISISKHFEVYPLDRDGRVACHIHCNFDLLIVFIWRWLPKCLVARKSVTCATYFTWLHFSLIFGFSFKLICCFYSWLYFKYIVIFIMLMITMTVLILILEKRSTCLRNGEIRHSHKGLPIDYLVTEHL